MVSVAELRIIHQAHGPGVPPSLQARHRFYTLSLPSLVVLLRPANQPTCRFLENASHRDDMNYANMHGFVRECCNASSAPVLLCAVELFGGILYLASDCFDDRRTRIQRGLCLIEAQLRRRLCRNAWAASGQASRDRNWRRNALLHRGQSRSRQVRSEVRLSGERAGPELYRAARPTAPGQA